MTQAQSISYIIFYIEFTGILVFLVLIWQENVNRSRKANQALIDVAVRYAETSNKSSEAALKAAEAASVSAETALKAVEALRVLVVQMEKPKA